MSSHQLDQHEAFRASTGESPLVSVVIPTKDCAHTLVAAIDSIEGQTYRPIEVIVVDNGSIDGTVHSAQARGCRVVTGRFSERSAQLNVGLQIASGAYFYRVDADFVLDPHVIAEAVEACERDNYDSVLIHNTSDAQAGIWGRIRKFERDMYRGDALNVAARFVRTEVLRRVGGFDEALVAGEDYDLHRRLIQAESRIGRISSEELHIGEPHSLPEVWDKHYYYGRTIEPYVRKHGLFALRQLSPARPAMIRHRQQFIENPELAALFLIYQTVKYSAGLAGFIHGLVKRQKASPPKMARTLFSEQNLEEALDTIIVSWNSGHNLRESIKPLRNCLHADQIHVVDNASTDGSVKSVPPDVSVLRLSRNEGFGRAVNGAFQSTTRDLVLLLNPDTRVTLDAINSMIASFDDPEVGAVQPLLLLPDGKVDSAGSFLSWSGFLVHRVYGMKPSLLSEEDTGSEIFAAKGAALMVRAAAFRDVGGFDPSFFLYFEDTDLCWRLWLRGWKVMLSPSASVLHFTGGSAKQLPSSVIDYHSFRNRISSLCKNLSAWRLALILPIHISACCLTAVAYLMAGRYRNARAVLNAVYWNIRSTPALLAARSAVQARRLRSDGPLFRMSYAHGAYFAPSGRFIRSYLKRW